MACAGQMRDTIDPPIFVTKLIFESPTNLGSELPIGSIFKEKEENFVFDIFYLKVGMGDPCAGQVRLKLLKVFLET